MPCPNVIFINPSDSGLTFCSSKKKIFNTSIAPQFYHLHNISSGVPFAFLATLLYDVMTGHIAMLCPFSFSSRLSCLIPPLRNLGIWSLSNQRQHLHMPLGLRVSLDAYIHGSPSMNAALMYVITPKIPTSHPRMVASFEVLSTRSHTLICAPRLEGILGVCLKYDLHYERNIQHHSVVNSNISYTEILTTRWMVVNISVSHFQHSFPYLFLNIFFIGQSTSLHYYFTSIWQMWWIPIAWRCVLDW